jgi:hypothetical protein
LARGRLAREKPLGDRGVGESLQLLGIPRMIEHMSARAKHLVERMEVQRIGVGQRAVDVEQQRPACSRHERPPKTAFIARRGSIRNALFG